MIATWERECAPSGERPMGCPRGKRGRLRRGGLRRGVTGLAVGLVVGVFCGTIMTAASASSMSV